MTLSTERGALHLNVLTLGGGGVCVTARHKCRPPQVYLDICRRYVGARLRTAYAYLEAEPLPHEHVARLASR